MIRLLGKVPQHVNLAFSGGVDSLAAAHFLKQGKKAVRLMHFNHGCEFSDDIQRHCEVLADSLELPLTVGHIEDPITPRGESLEAYWRQERYKFFHSHHNDNKVITCHHLDDAVESWVWSALHGNPHLIQPEMGIFLRPFLMTEKQSFVDYANRKGLVVVEDPFNHDTRLTRNYIRHNLLPHVYHVNPGLKTVIRKKYLAY